MESQVQVKGQPMFIGITRKKRGANDESFKGASRNGEGLRTNKSLGAGSHRIFSFVWIFFTPRLCNFTQNVFYLGGNSAGFFGDVFALPNSIHQLSLLAEKAQRD